MKRDYPGRILVVDDSRASRVLIRRFLHALGAQTAEAVDGFSAWRRVQADSFDLLITDYEMPGWDGGKLVNAIRDASRRRLRHLPVIMVSSVRCSELRQRTGTELVDHFLPKPIDVAKLDVLLRRITRGSRYRLLVDQRDRSSGSSGNKKA
ncbi:response regulator [Roseiconus nitratireducens]|uniref:response regulator n=1 Tax=Roseiconus nitratireducens TaxID=2605748 RepID=UPI001F3C755A|nr:response regulator [Roseiconus nitratireducens]